MRKHLTAAIALLLTIITIGNAQNYEPSTFLKVIPKVNKATPDWAVKMYSSNPNVFEVERLYRTYYKTRPFEKTIHTQNYKHWYRRVIQYVDANGFIQIPSEAEQTERMAEIRNRYLQRNNGTENSTWYSMGPFVTFKENSTDTSSHQVNVYSIAQSKTNPNLVICGTESCGVYKSTDKGLNWTLITKGEAHSGSNTAIEIHPTNDNIFFVSSGSRIYRTLDGGTTWTDVYTHNSLVNDLKFDPSNPNIVYACGTKGMYRTTDGGTTWTQFFTDECYDLDFHPTNSNIIYLLKKNIVAQRSEVFRSDDGGITWTLKDNGYFVPSDLANAEPYGGKIAVSALSPDLVYVCLIGNGKASDYGWIGVYKSTDKGENWTNPSGQDGAPYGPWNGNGPWHVAGLFGTYQQAFYNFDFEVSSTDAAKLWVGTINLSESTDGGASWTEIRGIRNMTVHSDIQDIDVNGGDIWVATDGGINYSSDELMTETRRMYGIHGSNFWGFSTGWNEDVYFGGRYHNGNSAYYEAFNLGDATKVYGVEEPTGYVHPIENRKVYYKTYGQEKLSSSTFPTSIGGTVINHSNLALAPNESYANSSSSGLYFDPRYADHLFMGRSNKIYKSTDAGISFIALDSFSAGWVREIAISRKNPDVIYTVHKPNGGAGCIIYKTTDGGATWAATTTIPSGNNYTLEITLNPDDENELWVGAPNGSSSNLVFKTLDGGTTWINMTGTLNSVADIFYQGGTNDVVYVGGGEAVFYYDVSIGDWVEYSDGLPAVIRTLRIYPFYRDAALRLGAVGRGAWGAPMAHPNFLPEAQPITYTDSIYCVRDTVQFDCHSILKHSGASWQWSFSPTPAYVSSATARNPQVVFGAAGNYDVTLTVTDGNGNVSTKTVTDMIKIEDYCTVPEGVAGKALEIVAQDDGVYIENLTPNDITAFTFSAWIKPSGTQIGFRGFLSNGEWSPSSNNAYGLSYDYYGKKLEAKWGAAGSLISDNEIPVDEWSYVAMTVKSDSLVLYLNDERKAIAVTATPATAKNWSIAQGFYYREFQGLMDEVTIWDRALSKEEVRSLRHRTKTSTIINNDANLIAYYQFNQVLRGKVMNKAGDKHAVLTAGAVLSTSSAPVGSGLVQRKTLNGSGEYDFNNVGAKLTFSDCFNVDGEMYITKLDAQPYLPANTNAHTGYWIINHYDKSSSTISVDSVELTATDASFISGLASTSDAFFHLRSPNSDAFDWTTNATARNLTGNTLKYSSSNKITSGSQIFLTNSGVAFTETTPTDYCKIDAFAGDALSTTNNGDLASINNLTPSNITELTISAWVKPVGAPNGFGGVISNGEWSPSSSNAYGLTYDYWANKLLLEWGDYGSVTSDNNIPQDEWSYVAMTVKPDSLILYLNDERKALATTVSPVSISTWYIARGFYDRAWKGLIDEVTIWDRALSKEEIRYLRHQTKTKDFLANDANLLGYYQFNKELNGEIINKAGKSHAVLAGGATRTASTAPIGGGTTQRFTLNGGGEYNFNNVGAKLIFSNCFDLDGEMYLTKLNNQPHNPVNANAHTGYWIINHYDKTSSLTILDSIELTATDAAFTTGLVNTSDAYLHLRATNSDDVSLWTSTATAKNLTTNTLKYGNSNNITGSTQIFLTNSGTAFTETDAIDYCATETTAGKALSTDSGSDYATVSNLHTGSITEFTVSAWVKPIGTPNGFGGIIYNGEWSPYGATPFGLTYDYWANKLRARWSTTEVSSSQDIPQDEWSYVAMTVKSDSLIVYLNDERKAVAATISPATIATWYIGRGFYSRAWKGLIDEVTIWNRALSKEEIRYLRHRTKTEAILANDANLLAYYQFNKENTGQIINKAGNSHAALGGNATIATSSAPIGGGVAQRKTLNGAGDYIFNNVGAKLTFNDCVPVNGEMYITKIGNQPHLPANANAHTGYWIINHYDKTNDFTSLDAIELTASDGSFVTGLSSTSDAYMHLRATNSDAFAWTSTATAKTQLGNTLKFERSNKIVGSTQIFLTNSGTAFTESDAYRECQPDTLPLLAVTMPTNNDVVWTPDFNLNTNKITITAWIKPDGIQTDWTAIVMSDNASVSGFNLKNGNNTLGYHWQNESWSWSWNSGLIVEADKWSHVAMVVEPTGVTLYVNGKPSKHTTPISATAINTLRIGNFKSNSNRNFIGEIDEVTFWTRPLTIGEIRRQRHLTQEKRVVMPSMLAYYQFNDPNGGTTLYDKSGNGNNGHFTGSPTRVTSTAPVGSGKSQRIVIGGTGQHNSDSSGVQLNFPPAGTHPNGVMIITQINHSPTTQLPSGYNNLGYYWIVNNYGTNQTFTALNQIQLKPPQMPNSGFSNAANVFFYKREDNEHLNNQWTQMCNPNSIAGGAFTFDNTCNMTGFSQLHVLENLNLPVELLAFYVQKTTNNQAQLNWSTATQQNFSHFEVEHSTNGVDFRKFKTVQTDFPNTNETQLYEAIHENPVMGYNFYRLKQVDLDGTFEYSDIKAIHIDNISRSQRPLLFPNPIQAGETLTVQIDDISKARMYLFQANGKLKKDVFLEKGKNSISIEGLSAGTYFYSIQFNEKIYNGRLVIME